VGQPAALLAQPGEPVVDLGKPPAGGRQDVPGVATAGEEVTDLGQREAEVLGPEDQRDPVGVGGGVLAVAGGGPGRLREQAAALVVADRLRVHACPAGQGPEGEGVHAVTLRPVPRSGVKPQRTPSLTRERVLSTLGS
jgi:hypothetical protein